MSLIKSYVKWLILGFTLFFIIATFRNHWQAVTEIRLNSQGLLFLFLALIVTILAHIWSGIVWIWILKLFKQSFAYRWGLKVYLITNVYKYLPGNVGHFYGRITAVSKQGISLSVASLSVLLEPLLMAASALLIALLSHGIGLIEMTKNMNILLLQSLILIIVLIGIHPFIINKVIGFLNRRKNREPGTGNTVDLETYPGVDLIRRSSLFVIKRIRFYSSFNGIYSYHFSTNTCVNKCL